MCFDIVCIFFLRYTNGYQHTIFCDSALAKDRKNVAVITCEGCNCFFSLFIINNNETMKKRFFIVAMMLLGISCGIQAQESKGVLVEEAKYEFKHHWFLQGGAGVGYTIGETQQSWDLFSPAAALNVGYQFTPLWAVRLGASGWEGRGGFPTTVFHNYDFNYVQAHPVFAE